MRTYSRIAAVSAILAMSAMSAQASASGITCADAADTAAAQQAAAAADDAKRQSVEQTENLVGNRALASAKSCVDSFLNKDYGAGIGLPTLDWGAIAGQITNAACQVATNYVDNQTSALNQSYNAPYGMGSVRTGSGAGSNGQPYSVTTSSPSYSTSGGTISSNSGTSSSAPSYFGGIINRFTSLFR